MTLILTMCPSFDSIQFLIAYVWHINEKNEPTLESFAISDGSCPYLSSADWPIRAMKSGRIGGVTALEGAAAKSELTVSLSDCSSD